MVDRVHVPAENAVPSTSAAVNVQQPHVASAAALLPPVNISSRRCAPAVSLAGGHPRAVNGLAGPHQPLPSSLSPFANTFIPGPSNPAPGPRAAAAVPDRPVAAGPSRPVVAGLKPSIVGVNDGANSRPFTDESGALTRFLLVNGTASCVDALIDDDNYKQYLSRAIDAKRMTDGVVLRFDDLRISKQALEAIVRAFDDVNHAPFIKSVCFMSASDYKAALNAIGEGYTFDVMQGNLFLCINRDGLGLTTDTLRNMALEEAGRFGTVYAYKKMGDSLHRIILRVEFFAVQSADEFHAQYAQGKNTVRNPACFIVSCKTHDAAVRIAMQHGHTDAHKVNGMGGGPVHGLATRTFTYPAFTAPGPAPSAAHRNGEINTASMVMTAPSFNNGAVQPVGMGFNDVQARPVQAFGGQPAVSFYGHPMTPFAPTPVLMDPMADGHLAGRRRYAHHTNPVDPTKILRGEDVRTTVMLRNVPNKMDVHELKDIVDATSRGKYDFSYLRIDFKNACNVGYAFINFTRPEHIIAFIRAHQNRPWNLYNSDKIAEVSYATRQGIHCLIDAFRNSCVMEEHPDHRPKLWYTDEDGPQLSGREKEFPRPNNMAKLQRSRANAETVGLFPPRGARGPHHFQAEHTAFHHGASQALATQVVGPYHVGYQQPSGSVTGGSSYGGSHHGYANGAQAVANNWHHHGHQVGVAGNQQLANGFGIGLGFPHVYGANSYAAPGSLQVLGTSSYGTNAVGPVNAYGHANGAVGGFNHGVTGNGHGHGSAAAFVTSADGASTNAQTNGNDSSSVGGYYGLGQPPAGSYY